MKNLFGLHLLSLPLRCDKAQQYIHRIQITDRRSNSPPIYTGIPILPDTNNRPIENTPSYCLVRAFQHHFQSKPHSLLEHFTISLSIRKIFVHLRHIRIAYIRKPKAII